MVTHQALEAALKAKRLQGTGGGALARVLAQGQGWSLLDIVCSAGPDDRVFEEQHSHLSVSFVLSGSFVYRSDHGRALLAPGSILLGAAGACFECGHDHGEGDYCLSFHYDLALAEEIARGVGVRAVFSRANLPPARAFSPLFARAARAVRDGSDAESLAFDALSASFAGSTDCSDASGTMLDERRASGAVRYVQAHSAEPLSVGDLAADFGLSRFHFLRSFKTVTGTTPHQYLIRCRLRAAAERLMTTKTPVTEIAYAVGFEDLSNFTRSFKVEFGVGPSQYRRNMR